MRAIRADVSSSLPGSGTILAILMAEGPRTCDQAAAQRFCVCGMESYCQRTLTFCGLRIMSCERYELNSKQAQGYSLVAPIFCT